MRLAGKVAIISGAASGMGDGIGTSARFEALDVTEEENWAAVVAAATGHFGKLDVLVNNAGISGSSEQDFYSTEAWHRIMAVNATGVFFGINYAIPAAVRLLTKSVAVQHAEGQDPRQLGSSRSHAADAHIWSHRRPRRAGRTRAGHRPMSI